MCDETTERELGKYLERKAITRRGFTKGAYVTLAASALFPPAGAGPDREPSNLIEREVFIPTPDGDLDGLFVSPAEGAHAAVIMWPDIHGVRPAFFDMARRLAGSGYSVLAANPYYRSHGGRLFPEGMTIREPAGRVLVGPHYQLLSPATVVADAISLVAWLDRQPAVDLKRGIGAIGFCMTGSWTLQAAAARPNRIKAAVSFHGGGLVSGSDDSPHLVASKIQGGVLIAIAENDHVREPEVLNVLRESFETAGVPAEIEVYDDAMHGWVPTDSRAHNPEQADRAWGRMLTLFQRELS